MTNSWSLIRMRTFSNQLQINSFQCQMWRSFRVLNEWIHFGLFERYWTNRAQFSARLSQAGTCWRENKDADRNLSSIFGQKMVKTLLSEPICPSRLLSSKIFMRVLQPKQELERFGVEAHNSCPASISLKTVRYKDFVFVLNPTL